MRLPLIVVCENNISGGVFDPGAGDHYVNRIDPDRLNDPQHRSALSNTVRAWSNDVWRHYRDMW